MTTTTTMHTTTTLALCLLPALAHANPVPVALDLGEPGMAHERAAGFTGLDGTPLAGQALAVDLRFAPRQFVRLYANSGFSAGVILHTDADGSPGWARGTGYLVDGCGEPLHEPVTLGSAASSDGWMAVGFIPAGEPPRPYDTYGVRLDLVLPEHPVARVTGGVFSAYSYPGEFGVGPGRLPRDVVPDGGGTGVLLALALGGLAALGATTGNRVTVLCKSRS